MYMGEGELRFARLVSVVRVAGFAGSNWGVVDELQKVFSVTSNDSNFLAMLTESIELVRERRLELLTGDVRKLCLCNKGFRFGPDEFLLKNNDAGAVGFLVFELRDLVGDLLLAISAGLYGGFNISDALDCYAVLVIAVD